MGSGENEQLQLRIRIQQILLMCSQSALLPEPSPPVAKFKREFDMVILHRLYSELHWLNELSTLAESGFSGARTGWI